VKVRAGEDGLRRCPWALSAPEFLAYHDEEWGRPVGDGRRVFEKLCLEGFQSGLSWLTILRKREAFRQAFSGFDPTVVAAFDENDVERLLSNPGIVRHRGKILATIANARATVNLPKGDVSLAALVWSYEPQIDRVGRSLDDLPPSTAESIALSKELKRLGYRFVGPTTVYAAMQALGVVNDHLEGCHHRAIAQSLRERFRPPR
jgi:DNA-3-methyladenine glycosylase I